MRGCLRRLAVGGLELFGARIHVLRELRQPRFLRDDLLADSRDLAALALDALGFLA